MVGKYGELTLYVGPMKSGKTDRLLSDVGPLKHSSVIPFTVIQQKKNVRDGNLLRSRSGSQLDTNVLFVEEMPPFEALSDRLLVAVEEFHFFGPEMVTVIAKLLKHGVDVRAAGLDMDYRGIQTSRYRDLLQLAPHKVIYCKAVCIKCGVYNGQFTQVYRSGIPMLEGLPEVLPEDGTYEYMPVCRQCFERS